MVRAASERGRPSACPPQAGRAHLACDLIADNRRFVFGDPLQRLPLGIRTLVVTAIVVPAMLYVVMPIMTPLFERWLYPSESREDVEEGTDPSRRG